MTRQRFTTAKGVLVVTEVLKARFEARAATALVAATDPAEDAAIARDYLRQHQERDTARLAGENPPFPADVVAAVEAKLRFTKKRGPLDQYEALLKFYCCCVEDACRRISLSLYSGVEAGIVWGPSIGPAQQAIPTTNASIIIIPVPTLQLCHAVCKLLSRSVAIKRAGDQISVTHASNDVLAKIASTPELRKYAAGSVAFCATHDGRCLSPLKDARGLARPLWRQLLTATELFVIAHEYAHHIALHRAGNTASVDGVAADSELR